MQITSVISGSRARHGRVRTLLVAERAPSRMRGLLGRSDRPRGEGVPQRPASSIHTHVMRFPIDVVFLDRDLSVLDVRRALSPWRTARKRGTKAVLELRAGEAGRRGIKVLTIAGHEEAGHA